jgi:glycolate oxidase FAD binding subunit
VSASGVTTQHASELRAICGSQYVIEDRSELQRQHILGVVPSIAVAPGSSEEIAAVLRVANEHGWAVVPAGGFTQQQSGNLPAPVDVLLSTSRLIGVEHYDPADLTVGVESGCTVAHLASMVSPDGLFFAVDPPLPQRSTIGGVLATARHGPVRHNYGGVRDFCIGIRFVTGDAHIAKGGGRVVKNVAGYDLMKLLIGSQGTLGVITSASFKLFPAPRQTRTFLAEFGTPGELIEFRNQVLHSPLAPMCLELVSPGAWRLLRPEMDSVGWLVCLRAAGSDAVLARFRTELGAAVTRDVEGPQEENLWRALADFPELVMHQPRCMLVSISLPLSEVLPTVGRLVHTAETNQFELGMVGRVGAGHLQAAFWPKIVGETSLVNFVNAATTLRNGLASGASMVVQHCPSEARHHVPAWGPTPSHIESMRSVKNALDPRDILNRGRFLF